jgi:hypothetical protein
VTVLDFAPPHSPAHSGVAVVQLHDDLWRITRSDGEVLGYVDRTPTASGDRFTARRMLRRQRRFLAVGEFWRFDDAMECFRF